MPRHLRAAASCAAAVSLVLPTAVSARSGAPTTALRHYAETSVSLAGRDGATYHVAVGAYGLDESAGQQPLVRVRARRCAGGTCADVYDERFRVPASALTIAADLGRARLATTLDGSPLTVTWVADGAEPVVPGLQVWASPTVRVGPQRAARAEVVAFGTRCADRYAVVARETTVSANDLYTVRDDVLPAALATRPAPRCLPEDDRR